MHALHLGKRTQSAAAHVVAAAPTDPRELPFWMQSDEVGWLPAPLTSHRTAPHTVADAAVESCWICITPA